MEESGHGVVYANHDYTQKQQQALHKQQQQLLSKGNDAYYEYYRRQNICNNNNNHEEEETSLWNESYQKLRTSLPITYRIYMNRIL